MTRCMKAAVIGTTKAAACTEGLTPVRGYRDRQGGSTRHFSIPSVVDQDAIVFEGGAQRLVQRDARRDVSDRGREFLGLPVRQIALLLGHRGRRGEVIDE